MRKLPVFFIALFSLFLLSSVVSPQAKAISSPLTLAAFQVSGFYAKNGESHMSGHLAWTPKLSLGPLGVRGELGLTYVSLAGSGTFVSNYEVLGSLSLLPLVSIEAGGGFQTWHHTLVTSTELVISVNLAISLIGPIDRIYAGYSRFMSDPAINIIKAGIGINL